MPVPEDYNDAQNRLFVDDFKTKHGNMYQGEMVNGVRNGYGTLIWEDGHI